MVFRRPNDGIVPLHSAKGDTSGHVLYPLNLELEPSSFAQKNRLDPPRKGVFNFLGSLKNRADHLSVLGMFDLVPGKRSELYLNLANLLSSL
jgi:hypothetical protein